MNPGPSNHGCVSGLMVLQQAALPEAWMRHVGVVQQKRGDSHTVCSIFGVASYRCASMLHVCLRVRVCVCGCKCFCRMMFSSALRSTTVDA